MEFGEWLGIAGLIVSLAGFTVAIWQIKRTANAAQEAATQITATINRMRANHLLVLLPQFRLIESDLDQAVQDDDRRLAQRSLVSYSHTANQVASLIESSEDGGDASLISRLRASSRAASAAKANLVSTARVTVRKAISDVAAEIGEISGETAGMIAQYQSKAE